MQRGWGVGWSLGALGGSSRTTLHVGACFFVWGYLLGPLWSPSPVSFNSKRIPERSVSPESDSLLLWVIHVLHGEIRELHFHSLKKTKM